MRHFRKLSSESIWDNGSVAAGLVAILSIVGVVLWTMPVTKTRMASKSFGIENVGTPHSGAGMRAGTTTRQ
jgi:hypothetical protein